jgi:NADP-dependent 3-hydroxy acid dehydrogenase YdfG
LTQETSLGTLSGKVAWVTGAGSGIGQAGAVALAEAGATVVISGRRVEALEETAAKIAAQGGRSDRIALDVGDKGAVARAVSDILGRHARIDILVASAGTNVAKRFLADLQAEDWDKVVQANLNGLSYCALALLPTLRKQGGGVIINIGSWLGRWPSYPGGAAYNATKSAVAAFTHQLNIEEGRHGIRACVIYPGEVNTPILKNRPIPPKGEEMARMLQPTDLGRTIRFVAEAPAHVCLNEIVITPTWNRFFLGGEDLKLLPPRG